MYLGIDIGGSKTLLAVFDLNGLITYEKKFPTNKDYQKFLAELKDELKAVPELKQLKQCCCAAPGRIDRKRGIAERFGNLGWENVPLVADIGKLLGLSSIDLENDAKLAGLSEAILVQEKYKKVVYVSIGTGIGDAIIINGKNDPNLSDSEAGNMVLSVGGKFQKWESLASGKALFKKYGKKASEIDDPKVWEEYAGWLALGIDALLATIQPDALIIGGGVGAHYEKFSSFLETKLKEFENDMVRIPPILKAQRPEEAVVYGCYEYIKQNS